MQTMHLIYFTILLLSIRCTAAPAVYTGTVYIFHIIIIVSRLFLTDFHRQRFWLSAGTASRRIFVVGGGITQVAHTIQSHVSYIGNYNLNRDPETEITIIIARDLKQNSKHLYLFEII